MAKPSTRKRDARKVTSVMPWLLKDMLQSLDDFADELRDTDRDRTKVWRKYEKQSYLCRYYLDAIIEGWQEWDWQRARSAGWLSRYSEKMFAKELRGTTPYVPPMARAALRPHAARPRQ